MVQIPSRLEFPTESYDGFSEKVSAERVLFRILFLLYVFYYEFLESSQMFRLYKELYYIVLYVRKT
jgi:hypothetical protein